MAARDNIVERAKAAKDVVEEARAVVTIAEGEVNAARAKLRAVQQLCDHPGGYATSCMGESGFYCPDCFYTR